MNIYSVVSIATNIADVFIALMFFEAFLTCRDKHRLYKNLCAVFIFSATLASDYFVSDSAVRTGISIMIFFVASLFFNNTMKRRILVICGYMAGYIACDIITTLLMLTFFSTDVNTLLNVEGNERMMGMILSKPIQLCLVKIVSLFKNNNEADLYIKYWLALLTIPVVNIALLFSIIHFFDNVKIDSVAPVYISAICILYINIIVFFLFDKLIGITQLKNKCDTLENQVIFQAEQVKKNEMSNKKNESIRHDIKLHFQLIYDFLKNKHYQNAISYMEDLDIVRNVNFQKLHTGNFALDSIMNAKLAEAHEFGIKTQIMCQVPTDLKMSEVDICSLFGNLLDNAIEGCECSNQAEQKITIILLYKINRLSCCMENTARNDINVENGSFKSNKKDKENHGIGIYNIKNIVSKYNGICEMRCEDNLFRVSLSLFGV